MNRNSQEFDRILLEQMKALKNVPVKKFETEIRKILRQKSTCKMWWTNMESREWDAQKGEYRFTNFRCCPTARNAGNYFCLVLDRKETGIDVADGFLTAV